MGDTQNATTDSHLPTTSGLYVQHMPSLDGHDHDFPSTEYENPPHHSLSPYSSMNIGGTLSRPASMASMTTLSLPPNSLSRVGSLSNLQVFSHPLQGPAYFYNPQFFTSPYPQVQQQQSQQGQQQNQQQSSPNNQLMGNAYHPILGSADFRFISDFAPIPQAKPSAQAKQQKKPRAKRAPPPPSAGIPAIEPPAKLVKMEKVSAKSLEGPKPQRSRNPSSVYRGVSKCSKDGRWQARIRVKRQVTYLGRFVNEEDAARRYDEAAREHHGDKAVLNFPTAQDKQLGRKQATSAMGGGDDEDSE